MHRLLIDLIERREDYIVKTNIPDARSEDIIVELDGRSLRVETTREPFYRGELTLPTDVGCQSFTVQLTDGVLEVRIAKARQ